MDLAARAAFDTDDGRIILARLSGEIKAQRFVLPSADTLERIGLAERARAHRLSAQALNDALGDERKKALEALLEHDPGIGRSRLTWLRTPPCSTCSAFRLLLVCATFRIVGWRASADPGGGSSSPPHGQADQRGGRARALERRLAVDGQYQNRVRKALGEIGRIERTLFMLDWMESPQLRMECPAGLNKGEARYALARAVFAHSQGRVHDRSHNAQQKRVMALNLVIAAIVYWNTSYIEKVANHLRRERRLPDPNLLRHVSPLGWEHIVLTGDYDWNSGAAVRTNARPLNLYPARIRA